MGLNLKPAPETASEEIAHVPCLFLYPVYGAKSKDHVLRLFRRNVKSARYEDKSFTGQEKPSSYRNEEVDLQVS